MRPTGIREAVLHTAWALDTRIRRLCRRIGRKMGHAAGVVAITGLMMMVSATLFMAQIYRSGNGDTRDEVPISEVITKLSGHQDVHGAPSQFVRRQPPQTVFHVNASISVGSPANYYVNLPQRGNRQRTELNEDQKAVKEMMAHGWDAYRRYAWGKDSLRPITKSYDTWFNTGLTIIDSLDTLWLMGMDDEYNEAREWAATELDLAQPRYVNVFECTIRCLGGLLSMYSLSGDPLWLEKADDLGSRILPAFKGTNSGLPARDINLRTGNSMGRSPLSTSEVSTLQLEFRFLAHLTGNREYADAVDFVMDVLEVHLPEDNLVTLNIQGDTGKFSGGIKGLGARADSFYEYLLKAWVQTGRIEEQWRQWYLKAVAAVRNGLIKINAAGLLFLGELHNDTFNPKMDHLACFYPGVLALGHHQNVSGADAAHANLDLDIAKSLTDTCFQMYNISNLKLGPEIVHFSEQKMYIKSQDSHCLLRPEAVEAFFILYRVTKDERYREYGRHVYKAINTHARLDDRGFAAVANVDMGGPKYLDRLDSFFFAETLKYLFLLFSDDEQLLRFDEWVFNTEAHPLPIFRPSYLPL